VGDVGDTRRRGTPSGAPGRSEDGRRRLDRLFDRLAPVYDLQLPLERRALRRAAAMSPPPAGRRVLDMGAGTGALAAALARRGTPRELVLLDRSARMLARAGRRLRRHGLHRGVRTVVGDACHPPVRGPFDIVVAGYLLHLLPRAQAICAAESARALLAPGGRMIIVHQAAPPGGAGVVYRHIWRLLARGCPALVAGGAPIDICALLREAGFRIEETVEVPGVYWTQVVRASAA
jgi:ubiquinone/menaquinone biosynthesis C-methylase UbiE